VSKEILVVADGASVCSLIASQHLFDDAPIRAKIIKRRCSSCTRRKRVAHRNGFNVTGVLNASQAHSRETVLRICDSASGVMLKKMASDVSLSRTHDLDILG
jgi:hypothetical protein